MEMLAMSLCNEWNNHYGTEYEVWGEWVRVAVTMIRDNVFNEDMRTEVMGSLWKEFLQSRGVESVETLLSSQQIQDAEYYFTMVFLKGYHEIFGLRTPKRVWWVNV